MCPISFHVEPTDYGWSVRVGSERLALFVTERQALIDVKRRRAELKAKGRESAVVVAANAPRQAGHGRSERPSWPRR